MLWKNYDKILKHKYVSRSNFLTLTVRDLSNFLSRAFGGAKSALGGLGTKGILGIGAGAGLLGGLFAKQPEETEEEYQARIEQLGPYLKQYYSNVGDTFGDQAVSPGEVEDFVTSQSIEYQGAKDGGIIGKKKKEKDKSIKEKILPKKKKDRLNQLRKELGMKKGGSALKPVDKEKNPGLAKLPTQVRNKMGYMKKGGQVRKFGGGKK